MPIGKYERINGRFGKHIKKKCQICNKDFIVIFSRGKKAKYCSRQCFFQSEKGRPFYGGENAKKHWFKKGHPPLYIEKTWVLSKRMSGENNPSKRLEVRLKISKALKGKRQPNIRLSKLGAKSHFWKGGLTPINKRLRGCSLFKKWREEVFERDNYICWICENKGGKLHPHHLKAFSEYPKLRFKISNGLTLCSFCHKTYTNFGN